MTSVSDSNRAAVLEAPGVVSVRDWPEPVPGDRDVVIRVAAIGVCGSDVHYFRHGRIGTLVAAQPIVLGHEAAGEVVAVGDKVTLLKVGDRVTIEPQRPCGHCEQCWSGAYNLCPDVIFMANPPHHGAFARRVVNPADFTFKIPDHLSYEEAALIEPLAVGFWACERLNVKAGSSVLVIGAGPIGVLAAQVAHARGASRIVVSDISEERLGSLNKGLVDVRGWTAHNAGSDPRFNNVGDVDFVIECSGAPAAVHNALPKIRPRGGLALVGINLNGAAPIDLWPAMARELSIHGVYRYAGIYPRAIALAASRQVNLGAVITHRFPLEETQAALGQSARDMTSVKSIVIPWQEGQ
jgi:L-iditol 2-dehydrogenase